MALPEPGSKDAPKSGKTGDQDDKDFDPTPEALIDEMDDERTLEEEEALNQASGSAVQEELDDLKKESEMPIEELLAYYERMRNEAQEGDENSDEEEDYDEVEDEEDEEEDYDQEVDDDAILPNKKRRKDDHDPSSDKDGPGKDTDKRRSPTDEPFNNNPPADSTSQQQYQQKESNDPNNDSEQSPTTTRSKSNTPTQHKQTSSVVSLSTQSLQRSGNSGMIDSSAQASYRSEVLSTTTHQQSNIGNFYNQHLNQAQQTEQTFYNIVPVSDDGVDVQATRQRQRMTQFNSSKTDEDADEGDGIFKSLLGYDLDDSDDMDEDYSYTDDENCDDERDWRRVIHVGPEFQADVPDGLSEYDNLPPYENDDQLVWKWNSNLSSEQILNYLKQGSLISKRNDVSISPASVPKVSYDSMRLYRKRMQDITSISELYPVDHHNQISSTTELSSTDNLPDVYMSQSRKRARIEYELEQENATDSINQVRGINQNQLANSKEDNSDSASLDARQELSSEEYFQDEEQLLFLLLKCNFKIDEALRRRKLDPLKYYLHEPMSLWSQEECLGFEYGLRTYGKDFRSIRDNRVQTRTHAEVVAFYYLWKKSERHDVYTNQYKIDRKRSLTLPRTIDYMDKFIEDNECLLNASTSPTPTPTDSTVGADSLNDGARQIQPHSFPLDRQTYLLRPLLQDTPVNTHTDSDTCIENKCQIR